MDYWFDEEEYESLYGNYRTRTFQDIWTDVESFLVEYNNIGLPTTISETSVRILYYLLYGRQGNSHIAASDENLFKYNLFSIVWQYGPTWEKKLEVQAKLRGLTEDELAEGSKQVYNTASNPDTDPSNYTDLELQFISNQNVTKNRKGILERYMVLLELLENDVTEKFISKFEKLFLAIVEPELPLWYEQKTRR